MSVDSQDACFKMELRYCQKYWRALVQNHQSILHFIITFYLSLTLSSCSFLGEKLRNRPKGPPNVVSKDEYNALLKRYEGLQNEVRDLRAYQREKADEKLQYADENTKKIESPGQPNQPGPSPPVEFVQTVDVFAEGEGEGEGEREKEIGHKEVIKDISTLGPIAQRDTNFITDLNDQDVKKLESDLFELRKAQAALNKGEYQQGIDILNNLQKSPYRQIQVRAKFLISEGLFNQGEFDLAMQSYEDIIQRSAFSGLVIKALERLIECAKKLKIDKKRDRYHSILHDFFEGEVK